MVVVGIEPKDGSVQGLYIYYISYFKNHNQTHSMVKMQNKKKIKGLVRGWITWTWTYWGEKLPQQKDALLSSTHP